MLLVRFGAFMAGLALACAGCASPREAAAPAAQRPMVLSDVHITGEFLTPTPAAAAGRFAGRFSAAPAFTRPTLGPISFQTPTPVPTGPAQTAAGQAAEGAPQPSTTASPAPAGATVQVSSAIPVLAQRSPTLSPDPTATPLALTKGQSIQVNLPAGTATCDTSQTFKFRYPGDNSTVTIDAQLDGLNPSDAGNAGLHLWDSTSASAPVITATPLTNQKNSHLGSIELTYQRPIAGPVTIELYNWTRAPLSGTVTVLTLASNYSPLEVVQQKSPGAC
jgi:hypothetical protein